MTLYLGKAHWNRLRLTYGPGISARQELHHRATTFPRKTAAMKTSPALGLATSSTSLGNAGKHQ